MSGHIKSFLPMLATIAVLISVAQAQTSPPAWNGSSSYQKGDIVFYPPTGNAYRAIVNQSTVHPNPSVGYSYWELYSLDRPGALTLNVGAGYPFPTFTSAWNYIRNVKIARDSEVIIHLISTNRNNTTNSSSPLNLDHPFGNQISITGDDQTKNVFNFSGSKGITLDNHNTLKVLAGVSIVGSITTCPIGIYVLDGASLTLNSVNVSGFGSALGVESGGSLKVSTTSITNFGDALSCTSAGRIEVVDGLNLDGGGVAGTTIAYCTRGGSISLGNSSRFSNCDYGIGVTTDSTVYAAGAIFNNIKYYAISCSLHAYADIAYGQVNSCGNGGPCLIARSAGLIRITGASGTSIGGTSTTGTDADNPGIIESKS